MKIVTLLALVCFPIAFSSVSTQEKAAVSVEEIFKAWQDRQDHIQRGRFVFTELNTTMARTKPGKATSFAARLLEPGATFTPTLGPAEDTTCKLKSTLSFDGEKMRYAVEGPQWEAAKEEFLDRLTLTVFNGRVEKSFYGPSDKSVFPGGFVDREAKKNSNADVCYLHAIFMTFRPFHPTLGRFSKEGWA